MKILWITNIQFPATREKLGLPSHVVGGWMVSLAMELVKENGFCLAVATIYDGTNVIKYEIDNVIYYLLPKSKSSEQYDKTLEPHWTQIVEKFNPDIIHVHGTEYAHGLACMNACPDRKYVISIQGLVSVYSEFYYAGIKPLEIVKHITINDLRMKDTIFHGKRNLKRRGEIEHEYIRGCKHIIGRTSWDYAHIKSINPASEYHFCNEVLRKSFYESPKWSVKEKSDHSIFLSQAKNPIKGLHQVLKAMAIVKKYYPKVHLRVTGPDITRSRKVIEKIRLNGYGSYLKSLINELNLNDRITFIGTLGEEMMVEEYRNAHVFICPSSIENSPNSLGEAQIIGTPCIASFVGGVPDMIRDGETGLLYRFDDHIMLAFQIIKVFNDDVLALNLSERSRSVAGIRHDRDGIRAQMVHIYSEIVG